MGIDFETIARLDVYAEKFDYQFVDHNPLDGASFYRLKFVLGEQTLSSPLKSIWFEKDLAWAILPNPVSEDTQLVLQLTKETALQLLLMDSKGQVLVNKRVKLARGNHEIPLELQKYSQGVYFLTIFGTDLQIMKFKLVRY